MNEIEFDLNNALFCDVKNRLFLYQYDDGRQYLVVKNSNGEELKKLEVLGISDLKKLVTFFYKAFNIVLKDFDESLIMPKEKLMECERKVLISGDDAFDKAQNAVSILKESFDASTNNYKENYERIMVYLDTPNKDIAKDNRVLRLTKEENVVKVTEHIGNNLPGDQKEIVKFFFNNTSLNEVIDFFDNVLGLVPITKEIPSRRTEYKCIDETGKFEVSVDYVDDTLDAYPYYSFEFECDNFPGAEERNSEKVTEYMERICKKLNLEDCPIVDAGTEEIYHMMTKVPFFEAYKIDNQKRY